MSARMKAESALWSDADLVAAARLGDNGAIRALIQTNNQRLFRAARAVLGNDAEAEDVVQEAYVRAFRHLADFEGKSTFSTWITRIAINEALGRKRRYRPTVDIDMLEQSSSAGGAQLIPFPGGEVPASPETETGRKQMKALLEELVDELPQDFRTVFVLREVEELSTDETAASLALNPATVKTRLHRARRLIRAAIEQRLSPAFSDIFPFDGVRCVNMAEKVMARLRQAKEAGLPPPP